MNRQSYQLTGQAQDAEQIWPGFTAAEFDHEDILLAMAPRPVRVIAATSDFFPIEGTRRTVERCRRFWKLCGQPDGLDLFEDQVPHSYSRRMAQAATGFFSECLLGKRRARVTIEAAPFPPARLACTGSGQVRGELPGAAFVYEANQERLAEIDRQKPAGPSRRRKEEAAGWLRQRVFAHRQPGALNPRFYREGKVAGLAFELALWWSQDGVSNNAALIHPAGGRRRKWPVTLAVWDDGTHALPQHFPWIRSQCRRGRAVLVLNVSGTGTLTPNPLSYYYQPREFYGVIHKFADDLTWLDDDLAALRTFDVVRALDLIAEWPRLDARDIRLFAHGRHGLYGQLAAALDPRLRRVQVVGGLGSFARLVRSRLYDSLDVKSVILRDVLRHFDLPELAAWRHPG